MASLSSANHPKYHMGLVRKNLLRSRQQIENDVPCKLVLFCIWEDCRNELEIAHGPWQQVLKLPPNGEDYFSRLAKVPCTWLEIYEHMNFNFIDWLWKFSFQSALAARFKRWTLVNRSRNTLETNTQWKPQFVDWFRKHQTWRAGKSSI